MEGVILFVDDEVNTVGTGENKLFLRLTQEFAVLPISDLTIAQNSIKSIGAFSAIILDWDFDIKDEKGTKIRTAHPDTLLETPFYSLIYVFSRNELAPEKKKELEAKFDGRIQFMVKKLGETEESFKQIKSDITKWKEDHKNLSAPIKWSYSINESIQEIFNELSKADINWLVDLHQSASEDGVNPEIEVVNLLQNILTEKIITKSDLLNSIKEAAAQSKKEANVLKDGASVAKLFQRIYYTDLSTLSVEQVPIMTGDIFLLDPKEKVYGVIINPECDIQEICESATMQFDLLTFSESDFNLNDFLELFGPKSQKLEINSKKILEEIEATVKDNFTKFKFQKPIFHRKVSDRRQVEGGKWEKFTEEKKVEDDELIKIFLKEFEYMVNRHIEPKIRENISQQVKTQGAGIVNELFMNAFNQTEKRVHLMPSFKFDGADVSKTAIIDFRSSKLSAKFDVLSKAPVKRVCKLNSPFIQELRQRYLAYYGRVGVPYIPTVLRKYNIQTILGNA
jgi:hypothetical protein